MSANPEARPLWNGIAYVDEGRDKAVTQADGFGRAVTELQAVESVKRAYGNENVDRLVIQCVYNTFHLLKTQGDIASTFNAIWTAFLAETAAPKWRFAAVANLNNFSYQGEVADLGHGVTLRGRSFEWLNRSLHWDQVDWDRLSEDWSAGGGACPFILVVETSQPKTAANFVLTSDGESFALTARALLAMRLLGQGDLHLGRSFLNRPAGFNVGIGGRTSTGWVTWRPGAAYCLLDEMLPAIRAQIDTLAAIESATDTYAKNVGVALRSFSSSYDRMMHQAEDSIIDSITALEALWKLNAELSFRLAFRTAALLGHTDDSREHMFDTLRVYYGIRSKIVHGSGLSGNEQERVRDVEPLRDIVRQMLRCFTKLLAYPGEWTVQKLLNDPDRLLLHAERRHALQHALGIGAVSPTCPPTVSGAS